MTLGFGSFDVRAADTALSIVQVGAKSDTRSNLTIVSGDTSHQFDVDLAITLAERSKGLMFRRRMAKNVGMLFDFGSEQDVSMWMRNTYIPLDMIFAREDGTIHHIAVQTEPHSEQTISSGGPVRYVLEINGGLTSKLDISAGDQLQHELIETD